MKTVKIRNIEIGSGIPKICAPIVGKNTEEILAEARKIPGSGADLAEWRADHFENGTDPEAVTAVLCKLRALLGELPLLFTFRTLREGGQRSIEPEAYVRLNLAAAASGAADLIDAELFIGEPFFKEITAGAHQKKVFVVASNHDFAQTPSAGELLHRLQQMQELDADILKIAVMPQSKKDVLTLLQVTEEMSSHYADRPLITMSMSGQGVVSRLCGEVFGSAVTFGSVGKASAPGQMAIQDLTVVLKLLHQASSDPDQG